MGAQGGREPPSTDVNPDEAESMGQTLIKAPRSLKEIFAEKDIWTCSTCFTCMDVCPRDAEFTEFMIALRNLAAKEGIIPRVYREQGTAIIDTGLAFRIPESRLRMREKYNLPKLPETEVEKVRRLLEGVGFTELIHRGEEK